MASYADHVGMVMTQVMLRCVEVAKCEKRHVTHLTAGVCRNSTPGASASATPASCLAAGGRDEAPPMAAVPCDCGPPASSGCSDTYEVVVPCDCGVPGASVWIA